MLGIAVSLCRGPLLGDEPADPAAIGLPPVRQITVTAQTTAAGQLPEDRSEALFSSGSGDSASSQPDTAVRNRPLSSVHWEATNLAHRPLYFEDEAVERNGQYRPWVQPAVSAAHFFGRVPALPYMMAHQQPDSCVYTLGATRPGSCVESYRNRWDLSARGGLNEAAVLTGLFFLIP